MKKYLGIMLAFIATLQSVSAQVWQTEQPLNLKFTKPISMLASGHGGAYAPAFKFPLLPYVTGLDASSRDKVEHPAQARDATIDTAVLVLSPRNGAINFKSELSKGFEPWAQIWLEKTDSSGQKFFQLRLRQGQTVLNSAQKIEEIYVNSRKKLDHAQVAKLLKDNFGIELEIPQSEEKGQKINSGGGTH